MVDTTPILPADLLRTCGEHGADIESLKTSEEDRKKENDARQREIGQVYSIIRETTASTYAMVRESTANVNSLHTDIVALKVMHEQDHATVMEHDEKIDALWDESQQNRGQSKLNEQNIARNRTVIGYVIGLLSAVAGWVLTKVWPIITHIGK